MKIKTFKFTISDMCTDERIDNIINNFCKDKNVINIDVKFIKNNDSDIKEVFTILCRDKESE